MNQTRIIRRNWDFAEITENRISLFTEVDELVEIKPGILVVILLSPGR